MKKIQFITLILFFIFITRKVIWKLKLQKIMLLTGEIQRMRLFDKSLVMSVLIELEICSIQTISLNLVNDISGKEF